MAASVFFQQAEEHQASAQDALSDLQQLMAYTQSAEQQLDTMMTDLVSQATDARIRAEDRQLDAYNAMVTAQSNQKYAEQAASNTQKFLQHVMESHQEAGKGMVSCNTMSSECSQYSGEAKGSEAEAERWAAWAKAKKANATLHGFGRTDD